MKWKDCLFRKNDIRGIYGEDFDLSFAKTLGRAFVRYMDSHTSLKTQLKTKRQVVVGHDSRLSSPQLAQNLSLGLCERGVEVLFAGLVSTPACFFANHFCPNVTASIMVTASHNPSTFNGFKFSFNKETLCDEQIDQLKELIQTEDDLSIPTQPKSQIIPFKIKPLYVEFMKQNFLSLKANQKIVIDCGNGSAGPLAQAVFKALGISAIWLYEKPDGSFPNHHPDPSLDENLRDLQQAVKKNQADFGVCFDGDGDRLVVVESNGRIFHGDETMSFFIYDLLSQKEMLKKQVIKKQTVKKQTCTQEKIKIVADVKCAPWFYCFLKKNQLQPVMWKSGHSLIRRKTLQEKALFGGELSGHFFFCDEGYCLDDGVYCVLRLLRFLNRNNPPLCLSQNFHVNRIRENKIDFNTNEIRIPIVDNNDAKQALKRLLDYYQKNNSAQVSVRDGVRVCFPKKWGLARFSNTQNTWTLRFGGRSQKLLEQIQSQFYQIIKLDFSNKDHRNCQRKNNK